MEMWLTYIIWRISALFASVSSTGWAEWLYNNQMSPVFMGPAVRTVKSFSFTSTNINISDLTSNLAKTPLPPPAPSNSS